MTALPSPDHPHGLTVAQQNAVDLLAVGKNDTETAEALGVHRVTVTRWRLYSPEFRAALADRRQAVWGAAADRLRALLPKALDTLADALEQSDATDRVNVALAVLKLVGPLPLVPTEPTDPDEILRREVEREREYARATRRSKTADRFDGLPNYDDHRSTVRQRLAKLALPANEPTAADNSPTCHPRDCDKIDMGTAE